VGKQQPNAYRKAEDQYRELKTQAQMIPEFTRVTSIVAISFLLEFGLFFNPFPYD
jgi:hypothetical protein